MTPRETSSAGDAQARSPTVTPLEDELGLGFYATSTPGIGGRLRAQPEDFLVEEDSAPVIKAQKDGKYTLARIRATNWETHHLMRELSTQLEIPERSIYFTGTKDKRAVTTQNLALAAPEHEITSLDIRGLEILETYRVDRAPKLGEHTGNRFKIRIRDLWQQGDELLAIISQAREELLDQGGFPNFFGPQRFGSVRPTTHLVGKHLVEGSLEEAVWTYIAYPTGYEKDDLNQIREELWEKRDPAAADQALPRRFDYEHEMIGHLLENPGDHQGALRQLPLNLTRLFVSAFQSHLFNRAVTRRAEAFPSGGAQVGDLLHPVTAEGVPDGDRLIPVTPQNLERCRSAIASGRGLVTVALPGYDGLESEGYQREIEETILGEAGVSPSDFRILDLPKLSSSGTRRAMRCPLDKLDVTLASDSQGTYVEIEFFLPKGSYATSLLREFMKANLDQY